MARSELLGMIGPMGRMAVIPGTLSGIIATAGGECAMVAAEKGVTVGSESLSKCITINDFEMGGVGLRGDGDIRLSPNIGIIAGKLLTSIG